MSWVGWVLVAAGLLLALKVAAVKPWKAREIVRHLSPDGNLAIHELRYPWLNSWAMDHWIGICNECGWRITRITEDGVKSSTTLHRCEDFGRWI